MKKQIMCIVIIATTGTAAYAQGDYESVQKAADRLKKAAHEQQNRPKIWHGPVRMPQPRTNKSVQPRRTTHLGHGPVQINNPVLLEKNMKQRIVRAVNALQKKDSTQRTLDDVNRVKSLIEDFEGFEAAHDAQLPDRRKTQKAWKDLNDKYEAAAKELYRILEQAQQEEESGIQSHMTMLRSTKTEKHHEESVDELIDNVKKLIKKIEQRRTRPVHGPTRPIKNPLAE